MKLGIGEFSLVTSTSIKALRLYHEKGLLVPADVDPGSGYRYYDETNLETRSFEIEEKDLDTMLIAGHRMQGRYEEIGKGLGRVCRKMGRHAAGKPMALYYDGEYKEEGADFEPCIPVSKGKEVEGISIRELKGGKCVSLIHKGPYESLRHSYGKVFGYVSEKGYKTRLPTREVYRKGPGLIFKGNPNNYLTEIQVLIEA